MLVNTSNMHFMQTRRQQTLEDYGKIILRDVPNSNTMSGFHQQKSMPMHNTVYQFRDKAVLQLSNLNKKKPCKNDMRFVIKRCFSKKKNQKEKEKKEGAGQTIYFGQDLFKILSIVTRYRTACTITLVKNPLHIK